MGLGQFSLGQELRSLFKLITSRTHKFSQLTKIRESPICTVFTYTSLILFPQNPLYHEFLGIQYNVGIWASKSEKTVDQLSTVLMFGPMLLMELMTTLDTGQGALYGLFVFRGYPRIPVGKNVRIPNVVPPGWINKMLSDHPRAF